jgi:hypothetical protein
MRVRIALAAATALTALGFAAPAMASGATSTGTVNVQVNILPTVSIWGANASLNLDGSNPPDNASAVVSTVSYINNVDANITASLAGLPPANPGQGIQFHIFPNSTDTTGALAAIHANGYGSAGALNFNYQNQGSPQTLTTSTGLNSSVHNQNIVYAAGLPGDLPAPINAAVVVTYTITQNP